MNVTSTTSLEDQNEAVDCCLCDVDRLCHKQRRLQPEVAEDGADNERPDATVGDPAILRGREDTIGRGLR